MSLGTDGLNHVKTHFSSFHQESIVLRSFINYKQNRLLRMNRPIRPWNFPLFDQHVPQGQGIQLLRWGYFFHRLLVWATILQESGVSHDAIRMNNLYRNSMCYFFCTSEAIFNMNFKAFKTRIMKLTRVDCWMSVVLVAKKRNLSNCSNVPVNGRYSTWI